MRVASVPTAHPFVRSLHHPDVSRLPDPPVPGAPPGRWWPSPWLDADVVRARAGEFDLLHLHFGFDDRTPAELRALVAALRAAGRPLVLTVHDLRNPHHADPGPHEAALDVLVPAAAVLVTLTPGAAARIRRRWGREARVLEHPAVVGPEWAGRPRPERDGFVVGLHAKSHRTNADPLGVARALAGCLPDGATLRVDTHDDERGRAVARALREAPGTGALDLRVHPPFDDDELYTYLQELDVSVLPHRWGTHSGWLEACHDLGTTALVPEIGYLREQAPCLTYALADDGPDPESLGAVLALAHRTRPVWRADPARRARRRAEIADAYAGEYRRALTGVAG
ncbi:glycosyltransferase family 1 protein [Pseudonocardia nematodicida]|uniref:Glycosyltransferase family 1 protein n=1 Tax=Pseudonocardia nematodicida TaxID=1206997 RepID=A0ABV1KJA9_9PSEU